MLKNPIGNNKNGNVSKFVALVAEFLLVVIHSFLAFWKSLRFLSSVILFRPTRSLLRFFFYRALVPLYALQIKLSKKLGFESMEDRFWYAIHQKMVHVLVVVVTVMLLFLNLDSGNNAKASSFFDRGEGTILMQLIDSEFEGLEEEEQLIVETFDQEAVISSIQQSYLDSLSGFRPQSRLDYDIVEEDLAGEGETDGSIERHDSIATNITEQDRTETIEYTVAAGDTVSTIAEKFKISISTILWENNLGAYSVIRPGDKLRILPRSGLNHKVEKNETIASIAKEYKVDEKELLAANDLKAGDGLKAGEMLFLPGGKKPTPIPVVVKQTQTSYTGFDALKNIIKTPNAKKAESGSKMLWPTDGHRITQYFTWRHTGLDVADKVGSSIYTADSGTVEYVGWGKGYGNQIVVNHGGGKKTRYAHLSKFNVEQGDEVSIGDQIGEMGSTGWSTGSHLHFEVIIDGTKYNPLNYIK